jgi:hypothetical protein
MFPIQASRRFPARQPEHAETRLSIFELAELHSVSEDAFE